MTGAEGWSGSAVGCAKFQALGFSRPTNAEQDTKLSVELIATCSLPEPELAIPFSELQAVPPWQLTIGPGMDQSTSPAGLHYCVLNIDQAKLSLHNYVLNPPTCSFS